MRQRQGGSLSRGFSRLHFFAFLFFWITRTLDARVGGLSIMLDPAGYGEQRDTVSAFLFCWPDGDMTQPAIKLPKIDGGSMQGCHVCVSFASARNYSICMFVFLSRVSQF